MVTFADDLNLCLRTEWGFRDFEDVRRFRWVDQSSGPIRKIFEFQSLRVGYSARWGFSLDLVPLFHNGRFRWKRTPKSAEFDLSIDPVDVAGSVPEWCSLKYFPGAISPSRAQIARVASQTAKAAHPDFARVASVSDLITLFEERAQLDFRRFSLENYVQTHLAWGIALVAVEKRGEGESHIAQFCEGHGIDRDHPFLDKAEIAASHYAAAYDR